MAQLRQYRDLLNEPVNSGSVGVEAGPRLREGRVTVVAALSRIGRDLLLHGLDEISASEKMSPTDKTIIVGLMRDALAPRRRKR